MRDWNLGADTVDRESKVEFKAYLWGIETDSPPDVLNKGRHLKPTYEGLKL